MKVARCRTRFLGQPSCKSGFRHKLSSHLLSLAFRLRSLPSVSGCGARLRKQVLALHDKFVPAEEPSVSASEHRVKVSTPYASITFRLCSGPLAPVHRPEARALTLVLRNDAQARVPVPRWHGNSWRCGARTGLTCLTMWKLKVRARRLRSASDRPRRVRRLYPARTGFADSRVKSGRSTPCPGDLTFV